MFESVARGRFVVVVIVVVIVDDATFVLKMKIVGK